MKRKFVRVMFLGTLAMSSLAYTSCTDYDDDIADLRSQVSAVRASLSELDDLIQKGSVITSVTSSADGVVVKLSDDREFVITNGQDGVDGQAGTNGTTWEISEDGFWIRNGVKTAYKAIGLDGKDGADGKDGVDGKPGADGEDGKDGVDGKPGADGEDGKDGVDGKPGVDGEDGEDGKPGTNGKYYVPNTQTGKFDIYQDGVKIKSTDISWAGSGVTAIVDGNKLTFSGIKGADGQTVSHTLTLGSELGSLVFVPSRVSSDVPYATTSKPFYHINSYITESNFNTDKTFKPQTSFKKSNIVDLVYRLNPSETYTEGMTFGFVNRTVTRAAGDSKNLLGIVGDPVISNGETTVKAMLNKNNLHGGSNYDIVALQAWQGQKNIVTSDNIHVTSEAISVLIVDSLNYPSLNGVTVSAVSKLDATGKRVGHKYYERTKKIQGNEETDAFVKQYVALTAEANLQFKYTESIDLKKAVGLYSNNTKKYLVKNDFTGMSYEFSLPKEYLANDDKKTNQQWFAELNDGVVQVNRTNLTNGLTPAIGRTPVVRVDAFLADNDGTKRMVATSYIKLEILKETPSTPDLKGDINAQIGGAKEYEYHNLSANWKNVGDMGWERINNEIYGATGLSSTTFWNHYGTAANNYEVELKVVGNDGKWKTLDTKTGAANNELVFTAEGVQAKVNLNDGATTTSYVKVDVNNLVKTENTYKDVDGKGAHYQIVVKIAADNNYAYKNIVLTQDFYVKEDCKSFEYNPLYYHATYDVNGKQYNDCVVVKGQLNTSGNWVMSSMVGEHFKKVNGKTVFEYYNTINNVSAIEFQWAKGETGVNPPSVQNKNFEVALSHAMDKAKEVHNMTYATTLVNGEKCNFNYNIVFVNPFAAGKAEGISIFANGVGERTGETKPQVLVIDNEEEEIYSWDEESQSLVLSEKATDVYKLSEPSSVVYNFDTTSADYKELMDNKTEATILSVGEETGVVTWKNQGTELKKDYNLTVIATVTFENLSVVKCRIPVLMKATR